MHPTVGEIDAGVIPGTEARYGRRYWGEGCPVCSTLNFLDVADSLRKRCRHRLFPVDVPRGLSDVYGHFTMVSGYSATPTK